MKVVGIVGSGRSGGNTETLTRIALEEIQKEGLETELISLAGKKIEGCDGCRTCSETGQCHIEDDFESVLTKMKEADGIILATPAYYGAATPQMTSLISRFFSTRGNTPLKNKVGGPIVVARRAGQNFTLAQLMFFFMISEMIVPGSSYWNVAFAGRSKGDVFKDEEGISTIKNFGQKVAWLPKKINALGRRTRSMQAQKSQSSHIRNKACYYHQRSSRTIEQQKAKFTTLRKGDVSRTIRSFFSC